MSPSGTQSYVSPSDNIQSPCSAKLASLRNKNVGKYVYDLSFYLPPFYSFTLIHLGDRKHKLTHSRKGGKSLFAKTLGAPSKFGDKPAPSPTSQ